MSEAVVILGDAPETLETYLKRMADSPYQDPCDREEMPRRLEVIRAVNENFDRVQEKFQAEHDQDVGKGEIEGAEFFTATEFPTKSYSADQWFKGSYGWADSIALYDKIKNLPEDPNWTSLFRQVSDRLVRDRARLIHGYPFLPKRTWYDRRDLNALQTFLEKWAKQIPESPTPALSPEISSTLQSTGALRGRWEKCRSSGESCSELYSIVRGEVKSLASEPNPAVRREGDTFVLRLNAHDFKGSEQTIEKIVSAYWSRGQYWSSPPTRVRIEWTSEQGEDVIYLVRMAAGGEGSFDRDYQSVSIPHLATFGEVAHEIGHALGLPDQYFESWDPSRCQFELYFTRHDLMSDTEYGRVTWQAWDELDRLYPKLSTAQK